MTETKGERVWRSLLDPQRQEVAASEWLLLYVVAVGKKSAKQIKDELRKLREQINAHNPDFYLVFPGSSDGHSNVSLSLSYELARFYEIGILSNEWQDGAALWSITEKGQKVLKEWWPEIRSRIPSIQFPEGQ